MSFTSDIAITFHFCFQESEKETRLLVETLRTKLVCYFIMITSNSFIPLMRFGYLFTDPLMQEDARDNLVTSEKKVRELEARLQDEQLVSANNQKVPNSLHGGLK